MPFKKGDKNINRLGRPKVPEIELLRIALEEVEKEKGIGLIKFAIRKAYEDNNVLVAILKKILPDKVAGQGFGNTEYHYTIVKTYLSEKDNEGESKNRLPTEIHINT